MSDYERVREWHRAFGVFLVDVPCVPPPSVRDLRVELIREEAQEVCEAVSFGSLEEVAKELADLLFVTYGTAVAFGLPMDDIFAAVHESNMSKLGDDGKPLVRDDGKVLKGPNYAPPDIHEILNRISAKDNP